RQTVSVRQFEFSDNSARSNPADLFGTKIAKPEVAIWPRGDATRGSYCRNRKLTNSAAGSDSSDLAAIYLSKPDIAIRPCTEIARATIGGGEVEFGRITIRGNAPQLVSL